jgi:hypothetical protein
VRIPIERCWAALENYWNGAILDSVEAAIQWASNNEVSDSVDGLRITAQELLQIAAQSEQDMEFMKQRQAETDQRFNVLLEEIRYLIRGNQEN